MNSIKEEVTLRECPFCGGEAKAHARQNTGATRDFCGPASHWVGCAGDCGSSTCMYEDPALALSAWNNREPDLRAKAEGLAGALRMIAIVDQGCGGTLTFQEMAESAMRQAYEALSEWDQSQ